MVQGRIGKERIRLLDVKRALDRNLGNFWRRLSLPSQIRHWSLTSLQQRLVKHVRYYWLLLAEGHLTRRLFGDMLRRIWALPVPAG